MITNQQIQEAAQKYAAQNPKNCAESFYEGVVWVLQVLEIIHNKASDQLEILKNLIYIKGTGVYLDWREIEEEYNWVAVDEDGSIYKYANIPTTGFDCWRLVSGRYGIHMKLSCGLHNWHELIFERPK